MQSSVWLSVEQFRFAGGKIAWGEAKHAFGACALYFMALAFGTWIMGDRKAFEIRSIFILHNAFLVIASFSLLVTFAYILIEKSFTYSPWEMICSPSFHNDGRLHVLYYLNYLVKWYELLDTGFLVLKKRPVIFLHAYHHAATLLLCWVQMDQYSAVQWVPICINLLVHVVMYYYYALAAMGIRVWWKAHLTQLQILQFVVDLIACGYASTHEPVMSALGLGWVGRPACHGTLLGASVGLGVLSSYLVLFLGFYVATYKPRAAGGRVNGSGTRGGRPEGDGKAKAS